MYEFGPANADVHVLTSRGGMLSGFGHDLKLKAHEFSIVVEEHPWRVKATIEAGSVAVENATERGFDKPDLLSDSDRARIDKYLEADVLQPTVYPTIQFTSEAVTQVSGGFRIVGKVSLHGVTSEAAFTAHIDGDSVVAEPTLEQSRFGIRPFRAMMGALRVEDEIVVRVRLPWPLHGVHHGS